jgi:FkbM family methyltransferase
MSGIIDWDELVEKLIRDNVKDNWICCDVGSCIGRISNVFLDVAKSGKVYAFDINYNNPSIHGCINERIAISDLDGVEKVYYCGSHMSNILGYDTGKNVNPYIHDVKSTRLDTYFDGIQVDCIKIDIEGAELKAIKGGLETLKKCSLIIIECHMNEDWEEIYDLLVVDNNMVFYEISTYEKITRDVLLGPRGMMPYQIFCIKNKN